MPKAKVTLTCYPGYEPYRPDDYLILVGDAGNCKTDTPDIQTQTIHVTPDAPDPFTRHTVADGVLTLTL